MEKSDYWHALPLEEIFIKLNSSISGLSESEAQSRLAQSGPNKLEDINVVKWHELLFEQFKSLPIIMLIIASAISFTIGVSFDSHKLIDAFAITIAILIAVIFGFFQEYKAEKAMEALKRMVVQRCRVVRHGKQQIIESERLVPGDIVELDEGSRVPADMRIIEAVNLACDESMLTGESKPASKNTRTLPQKTPLAERKNMLFSGTVIVRGHCRGIVVATGMNTEFGKIVKFVSMPAREETPLQTNLTELSKKLGYSGIALSVLFFAIGALRGENIIDMFIVAVTLAVAVIPEGLPTVLAITLAIGVQKMARKNAIVRKMPAVETLGSATVICTDKTGTITQSRMEVRRLVLASKSYHIASDPALHSEFLQNPAFKRAMEVMAFCNNAVMIEEEEEMKIAGDPTETALLSAAVSCCKEIGALKSSNPQIAELPFDSNRKMMSSIRHYGKEILVFVKGSPDSVFPLCKKIMVNGKEADFSRKWKEKMASDVKALGQDGLRVLALAYRNIGKKRRFTYQNTEKNLVLVGLVAMGDPPRPGVAHAIELCKSAGIRVVMISGDSLATSRSIAIQVGLIDENHKCYEGSELEKMSDEELEKAIYSSSVFARATPEQKYRIVDAFKRKGEIVAVTGDGVNDAPAIRRADIGIAMGITGTDVTKEISDIVLTDDNFSSIMHAIRYGRTTFNNIKSFVRYQISTNVAALFLMFSAPALGLPIPLLPLQILWINIIVDGPPALALGAEPPKKTEMNVPPRNPKEKFLSKNLVASIVFVGALMAAMSIAVFSYYVAFHPEKASTAVFTLFVFLQLANAINCRSSMHSAFKNFFGNIYLLAAILLSFILQMLIIFYLPLEGIFRTVPLSFPEIAALVAIASLLVVVEELRKRFLPSTTKY